MAVVLPFDWSVLPQRAVVLPFDWSVLPQRAVVLPFACAAGTIQRGIMLARGEAHALRSLTSRTWLFLVLSGVATGVSWLAYFHALKLAPASRVAPIDKLSLALTVTLAFVILREPVSARVLVGAGLMVAGALVTL